MGYKKLYGLTVDEVEAQIKLQDRKCASCQEKKKLVVDHCHQTGIFLGMLCDDCNVAKGRLREDVKKVRLLYEYMCYCEAIANEIEDLDIGSQSALKVAIPVGVPQLNI